MTSVQFAATRNAPDGWDSDGSLSWEDFFGTSTDLVPTLLGMYDALVGRPEQAAAAAAAAAAELSAAVDAASKRSNAMTDGGGGVVTRPLSVSSIASSSSSSSGASSCSGTAGGRLGGAPKSSAYLASIESLEDDDSDDDDARQKPGGRAERLKGSIGSQGSGDSGVGSPCSYISSPSPPQGRPRYCDPHLSYMDRVVMEILETEGVYVKDLQQVIQGYLGIWRASPDRTLGDRQLSDLFSNIEQIHHFNSGFLEQLEQCGLDPVQVARCFVQNNAGFAVYTQYCTNYPRTVSVLTELMRKEATVRLFRERQSCLQHALPLGSYLLKPVQRILKYHLLLQNLVKHYACEAEGYSDIVDALSAMTGIAHHINNMKRRHEHSVRVQEIQSLLYGWEGEDLTTFGELCAEGAFRLSGAKAPRHAFLFDKMLLITKKKEEANLGYKAHIMCSNLMLIESVPGEPLSFHVIPFDNPRLQYTLQARNLEQKREWTLQLKRVILENYNAVIPSHARQLVMELGQNRTDDDVLAERGTPKRQHSAPEYLEKRKQERDRRKSETGLRSRLRRSRKSDAGSITEGGYQRGRRASSSSHDRSLSRESPRSLSPIIAKERFGSWRRKSEPGCYSPNSSNKNQKPLLVPVTSHPDTSLEQSLIVSNGESNIHGSQANIVQENVESRISTETAQRTEKAHEKNAREEKDEEEEAKTLEEIVGQLLMQNHEFQKILKKQQRSVGLRHRSTHREETTDTENDEEGIYETLTATTSTPGVRPSTGVTYRSHRHAHMRALRNQQKTLTTATGLTRYQQRIVQNSESKELDSDYVTLMCHTDKNDQNFKHNLNSRLSSKAESEKRVLVRNEKSLDSFGGERCLTDNFRSVSESRISQIWKQSDDRDVMIQPKPSETAALPQVQADGFGNYDNLQHIWESVKKQQEEIRKLAEKTEAGEDDETIASLSRRRSFSCRNGESIGMHSQHPSMSHSNLNYTNTPTSPAVWLKQQGQHLATPGKKSGSLPRSFQLSHDAEQKGTSSSRTKRSDRPFTIASDKPPEINFEDIERYIEQTDTCHIRNRFPLSGDTTEEDSMTEYTATPNASMNELNVHPEYKIYRPTVSRATLKHVISSVRLGGTRASSETLDEERERRASRLVYALARQYSKTLRQRIRNIMGDDSEDCYDQNRTPSPVQTLPSPNLPIYKQGSSSLGARIAHSEYANPRLLYPNIQPQPALHLRPDSVLSVSSHFTSSSEGEKTTTLDTSPSKPSEDLSDGGSGDSFYERSFDAIESLLENDAFRDSAVFSDHDESSDMTAPISSSPIHGNTSTHLKISSRAKSGKIPPPIPAKPDALKKMKRASDECKSIGINLKKEHLVHGLEGICKSIRERRRELEQCKGNKTEEEGDTSSQHSTASTVIEVGAEEEGGTPKGWVKHVVGKLQGGPGDVEETTKCQ